MLHVAWLGRNAVTGEVVVIEENLMGEISDDDAIIVADQRLALGGPETGYQISDHDGGIVHTRVPPEITEQSS